MANLNPVGQVRSVAAPDGVMIEYEVVGAGEPIALLHGGFVGRYAFSRQRALAERFRLILPSSRGHDRTDGRLPPHFGFGTTEVEDLCAVLQAEAGDRVHLIGHSSGGAVAFAFARRFPERVDHLVLIEPTLLSLLPSPERELVTKQWSTAIEAGESEGDLAALRATMEYIGGEAWRRLDAEAKSSRLQALASMAHITIPHLRGLLDFEVTEADVRTLGPPTLLIYGSASFDFEPAIQKRLCDLRPDLQSLVIEGAGHNSHRERPEIVNAMIDRFLVT